MSKPEAIRSLLETRPLGGGLNGAPTLIDLAGDLIGSIRGGPVDLSTNNKYIRRYGR
jgi:hypothetical protein